MTWFTGLHGRLDAVAGAVETDTFTADATDRTPAAGGRTYPRPASVRSGQVDQRSRESRADVLAFATPPFTAETLLAGPVRADVWSSTDRGGADVALTLVDVGPDGRALNIAEGVRRRRDADSDAVCFDVDLGHVAHLVRPGHALRLDVAAGAFPRIDWFPDEGRARRTVAHGGATATRLTLPVVT
jgi:putative CocE/NonD family hydrolase